MLAGRIADAQEAAARGVELAAHATRREQQHAVIIQRVMSGRRDEALALIRDLVWQAEDNDFDSQLQAERFAQRTAGRQPDFKEGVKAFLEKRPANFKKA